MKKKILLSAIAIVVVMGALVGATLAWFSSEDTKTNVVTLGNLTVVINEYEDDVLSPDGLTYDDILPGDTPDKDAKIELTGADAYVRAWFEVVDDENNEITLTEAELAEIFDSIIPYGLPDVGMGSLPYGWELYEGKYYYVDASGGYICSAGEYDFFGSFEIPKLIETQNAGFKIVIYVQAIQSANLTNAETLDGANGIANAMTTALNGEVPVASEEPAAPSSTPTGPSPRPQPSGRP